VETTKILIQDLKGIE